MTVFLGRTVANLGNAAIQKIPNQPHSGDVWFVVDSDHLGRACIAAHEIENIIICA